MNMKVVIYDPKKGLADSPILFEADLDFQPEIIYHNGTYYRKCAKKGDIIGVVETAYLDGEDDQEFESEITCPACGHSLSDSWEMEEEDDDYECSTCGSIFSYERIVTVEYSSQLIEKKAIKEV